MADEKLMHPASPSAPSKPSAAQRVRAVPDRSLPATCNARPRAGAPRPYARRRATGRSLMAAASDSGQSDDDRQDDGVAVAVAQPMSSESKTAAPCDLDEWKHSVVPSGVQFRQAALIPQPARQKSRLEKEQASRKLMTSSKIAAAILQEKPLGGQASPCAPGAMAVQDAMRRFAASRGEGHVGNSEAIRRAGTQVAPLRRGRRPGSLATGAGRRSSSGGCGRASRATAATSYPPSSRHLHGNRSGSLSSGSSSGSSPAPRGQAASHFAQRGLKPQPICSSRLRTVVRHTEHAAELATVEDGEHAPQNVVTARSFEAGTDAIPSGARPPRSAGWGAMLAWQRHKNPTTTREVESTAVTAEPTDASESEAGIGGAVNSTAHDRLEEFRSRVRRTVKWRTPEAEMEAGASAAGEAKVGEDAIMLVAGSCNDETNEDREDLEPASASKMIAAAPVSSSKSACGLAGASRGASRGISPGASIAFALRTLEAESARAAAKAQKAIAEAEANAEALAAARAAAEAEEQEEEQRPKRHAQMPRCIALAVRAASRSPARQCAEGPLLRAPAERHAAMPRGISLTATNGVARSASSQMATIQPAGGERQSNATGLSVVGSVTTTITPAPLPLAASVCHSAKRCGRQQDGPASERFA
eukprot:gnl/TRDRNA2_/TRDRNA2_71669_c0_seq1.p1 gnl/TRDRNA2_/TRDRNA2_71669_c0~~gnl/TRDRNA2_/TRDRNA2_71669_c0_seq1.p1  ORF type:complete len:662 (+),score=102.32 gnl/TRDRNA2_/TRDRNA2_71669_c0_seq1:46-1986(+)